jgi:hypothetical protein
MELSFAELVAGEVAEAVVGGVLVEFTERRILKGVKVMWSIDGQDVFYTVGKNPFAGCTRHVAPGAQVVGFIECVARGCRPLPPAR